MTDRVSAHFPPPTMPERAEAARAAQALRDATADPSTMGARSTMHIDLVRPRRGQWITTWAGLPGFSRINGRYQHAALPGWEYARDEVLAEMIPDLRRLRSVVCGRWR